jgi:hypothetical protein
VRPIAFAAIKGAVLMAGDPTRMTWFATYWQFLKTDAEKATYASRMAAYDPVSVLPTSEASFLLQFGSNDVYISRRRRTVSSPLSLATSR